MVGGFNAATLRLHDGFADGKSKASAGDLAIGFLQPCVFVEHFGQFVVGNSFTMVAYFDNILLPAGITADGNIRALRCVFGGVIEQVLQYLFGAQVESDWSEGSEILWKGEMKGKKYEDKGVILKIDPRKTLQYSHFSPMSGKADKPENYHTITINLAGSDNRTEVSLSQDNNPDEEARKESAKNWGMMLEGLKKYVEKS